MVLCFYFHIFKPCKDFFFRLNKVALEITKGCIKIVSVSLYNKRERERKTWSLVLKNVSCLTGCFMYCEKCVTESYIVPGVSPLPTQYHVAVLWRSEWDSISIIHSKRSIYNESRLNYPSMKKLLKSGRIWERFSCSYCSSTRSSFQSNEHLLTGQSHGRQIQVVLREGGAQYTQCIVTCSLVTWQITRRMCI